MPPLLLRRILTASLAGAATALASLSPASATAVGFGKVGSFCYTVKGTGFCAPGATIGHIIRGHDRYITSEEASVQDVLGADTAGGHWCNWHIDWRYSNAEGHTYRISRGAVHASCAAMTSIGRTDHRHRTLEYYGKACADFYASGQRRGSQCHNIIK
jgi:hypothetical protein